MRLVQILSRVAVKVHSYMWSDDRFDWEDEDPLATPVGSGSSIYPEGWDDMGTYL